MHLLVFEYSCLCRPTCISHTCGSDWIYVGTDAGNVHVVHIHTFKISGFTIYWNHALDV